MRCKFGLCDQGRELFRPLARAAWRPLSVACGRDLDRRQHQSALAPADQFQIDSRGQLGIEQRAMLGARRQIDAEALAEFVQRIARAGNLALGDLDRVDGARQRDRLAADALSSALMNLMSKLALWMTSGASPRNSSNSSATWAKSGLSARNSRGQPMHALGFDGHVAFGIEIELQRAAGGEMIHQLDTADFDDAVTVAGLKAGRFGVENDLTH